MGLCGKTRRSSIKMLYMLPTSCLPKSQICPMYFKQIHYWQTSEYSGHWSKLLILGHPCTSQIVTMILSLYASFCTFCAHVAFQASKNPIYARALRTLATPGTAGTTSPQTTMISKSSPSRKEIDGRRLQQPRYGWWLSVDRL